MNKSLAIYSVELMGLDGFLVTIEVDTRMGLPCFTVVGLGDASVMESRERVKSAIVHCDILFPRTKLIVNLAPADVRKVGPRYDLPIALGVLVKAEALPAESLASTVVVGELGLNGVVRPVSGVLATVEFARNQGFKRVIVPRDNEAEARLITGIDVVGVGHLLEVIAYLNGRLSLLPGKAMEALDTGRPAVDMQDIKGHGQIKRALMVAAAGGHHVLMHGAPGAGKTMLARSMAGILPAMSETEKLEVTKIYSAIGQQGSGLVSRRPFRSVHHTASAVSIVGGGTQVRPGEITLAHRGVLFLDEIAEFPSYNLDVLRQPMEDQEVTVARASGVFRYPCEFMLVAAMNPCPCGFHKVRKAPKKCLCSNAAVKAYRKRLSGPILDRFDLHLKVTMIPAHELDSDSAGENSEVLRARVQAALAFAQRRLKGTGIRRNGDLAGKQIEQYCKMTLEAKKALAASINVNKMSTRAYYRVVKVARTIADFDEAEKIELVHLMEATRYRSDK